MADSFEFFVDVVVVNVVLVVVVAVVIFVVVVVVLIVVVVVELVTADSKLHSNKEIASGDILIVATHFVLLETKKIDCVLLVDRIVTDSEL